MTIDELTEYAMILARGGSPKKQALSALMRICETEGPPFTEGDVKIIWETAGRAVGTSWKACTDYIQQYLQNVRNASFSVRDVSAFILDRPEVSETVLKRPDTSKTVRDNVRKRLWELSQTGKLRPERRAGWYHQIDQDLEPLDWLDVDTTPEGIMLPFNLNKIVEIFSGNVILVSGCRNAGKTAILLNIVKDNMHLYDVTYFNSEMDGTEFKKRLTQFDDVSLNGWRFKPYRRRCDFADVLEKGKGNLNVIDYLEIYENFYEIGARINEIWEALDGAIAVIAVQKPMSRKIPLGGELSLDKPRLVLAVDKGKVTILKAKNWAPGVEHDPDGKVLYFKLLKGANLMPLIGAWRWEDEK